MECKRPLLSIGTIVLIGTIAAQNFGEIRGKVSDDAGDPVPFAHVTTTVAGELFGATTGNDGKFILKPLAPGAYTVKVSYVGLQPIEIMGVEVTSDRATYLNDLVMSNSITFDPIIVVAPRQSKYVRPLIDIDDPSRMSLLADEFERDPNKRDLGKMIEKNFAGVTASPHDEGLHFRGSRTENMVTFLDGVKISGSVPSLPASGISSISVYTGGLPAKYGDVTGGVVVIETMSYPEMYERERIRVLRDSLAN